MMTPVYDEAIADWNTKNCSIDNHAERKSLSALLNNSDRSTQPSHPVEKYSILHRIKQVKTNAPQIHYLLLSETNNSFLDGFKTYQNLKDFLAPTGIDVLWRQVKLVTFRSLIV